MTTEQMDIVRKAIQGVFGECKIDADDESQELYVEARGHAAVITPTACEVDSIAGPKHVNGFSVGIYTEDGEFEEEHATPDLWEAIMVVASLITEGILTETRWAGFDDAERQYE